MKPETVKQLVALNRAFYSRFAREFSETRPSGEPRLSRIVSYVPRESKLLDVGCGNGRLAERLDQEARRVRYIGIDLSSFLVAMAASQCAKLRNVEVAFRVVDITQPDWPAKMVASQPPLPFPAEQFDTVTALAVLQHIPGFATRRAVLQNIRALLRPGGLLVMTNWQFLRNEKSREKVVDWKTLGVDEQDLEPGDHLLTWKRGGIGYRYCHQLTQVQVQELATRSGYRVLEQFYADDDMNLYSVLERGHDPVAAGKDRTTDRRSQSGKTPVGLRIRRMDKGRSS